MTLSLCCETLLGGQILTQFRRKRCRQQLCKFLGTTEILTRERAHSPPDFLVHQYGRRSIVLGTPIWPP